VVVFNRGLLKGSEQSWEDLGQGESGVVAGGVIAAMTAVTTV